MHDSRACALKRELDIDPAAETRRIAEAVREQVGTTLRRRGLVVAMSGGLDSSVCAALAVHAVGPDRVFGLMLPERESGPESLRLATAWARQLGVPHAVEDATPLLEAAGCYRRRTAAIRRVIPEFRDDWGCKIGIVAASPSPTRLVVFSLTVESPSGEVRTLRLPPTEYREIVAATSFKQRVRKMLEYYHADRLHYAVLGTPNRLEHDQGFFVKGGDGLADVKPIAHLYKTQVMRLAEHLGVPEAIRSRVPTTDTYSLAQTQEEFFFTLPLFTLDVVLFAHDRGVDPEAVAADLGLPVGEMARAYRDIDQKRSTTRYLHLPPLLVDPAPPPAGPGPQGTD